MENQIGYENFVEDRKRRYWDDDLWPAIQW